MFTRHTAMMYPRRRSLQRSVATQLSRAQRDRTNGPEQLCDDFAAIAPTQMARHLHPLYTKISVLQQEPLRAKGGAAAGVYKNKGTPSDIKFYRSMFVGSNVTKHHNAFIRAKLTGTMAMLYKDYVRRQTEERYHNGHPHAQKRD